MFCVIQSWLSISNPNIYPNPNVSTKPFSVTQNLSLTHSNPNPYSISNPVPNPQVRMEMTPFECYIHVNAIMWRVVYRELRALTNDAELHLNPMELNDVYEHLWNVGTLLMTDDGLSVLDSEYRPWPKVKEGTEESKHFYEVHDRDKQVEDPTMLPSPAFN